VTDTATTAGPAPRSASSNPTTPPHASPVDYDAYGLYGPGRGFDKGKSFQRPIYRFQGRITADGSSGYPAAPGRYHLYISWGCPWAQRTAIVRKLKGLEDVVSVSYVDDERDGRGWAFRERRGPDPVNGFEFLAQAYEATEPGYDGHVSVPVLWDTETHKVVSNNFPDITLDLGAQFGAWARPAPDLYPEPLRPEIDALNERVYTNVNNGPYRVAGATTAEDYENLRQAMISLLEELDARLAGRRFLFGAQVTEADVRLWPTLARFDTGYNPLAGVTQRRLTEFGHLWGYARDLYRLPAFRETTDFTAFGGLVRGPRPTFVTDAPWRLSVEPRLADWDDPPGRDELG
jgi:glutathione S-transferase/putative glutathione S-transferase